MLGLPPSRLRSLLTGLGCAVLLHGACDALRMGPAVFVGYALLAMMLVVRWRQEPAPAGVPRPLRGPRMAAVPEFVQARLAQGEAPSHASSSRGRISSLPSQRTFWARVKLWVGGVGTVLTGVWWVLLAAMLFIPDPATALDGIFTSHSVLLVTLSLLLTLLFLVILRSGLRGPADPLAPDQGGWEPLRGGQPGLPGPAVPTPGKKPHLRLVRNVP